MACTKGACVELNVIKNFISQIRNSVITYHWQTGNFLFLKGTYKLGNHKPENLWYALSPAHWCDYFIHLSINQNSPFIVIYSFI